MTGAETYGLISGAVELHKSEQSLVVLAPGDTPDTDRYCLLDQSS